MRQSIKIAALATMLVFTGYVTYSQSVPPTLGNVTNDCTLDVAYTVNTLQPIAIDTAGTTCVPSFGPGPLLCDSGCSVLITDGGGTVLVNTSP